MRRVAAALRSVSRRGRGEGRCVPSWGAGCSITNIFSGLRSLARSEQGSTRTSDARKELAGELIFPVTRWLNKVLTANSTGSVSSPTIQPPQPRIHPPQP
eukprot:1192083-Prorocentrum_minimum.AAC.1